MPKYEADFAMTCGRCYDAAKTELGKEGITEDQITADIPNQKLWVTCDKSSEEVKALLEKTGVAVNGITEV